MDQGLMDCIVGADDKIRACFDKNSAGGGEKLSDFGPVGFLQKSAVFSKAERMQDDLGMVM